MMIWEKWHNRPVIVSFDDKHTPIATIPFPAMTVCTSEKFNIENVDTNKVLETYLAMQQNRTLFDTLIVEWYFIRYNID